MCRGNENSIVVCGRYVSYWGSEFVSPRTLVTAGHCVYIKHSPVPGRDGWVKKIQVMPGRNGSDLPFGGISATEVWSVKGWGDQGQENYDYGAIILPSPSLRKLPVR